MCKECVVRVPPPLSPRPSVVCSVQGVSDELQESQREAFHLRQAVQDKDTELEVLLCWTREGQGRGRDE